MSYNNHAPYLEQHLEREATPEELLVFEHNQNLLKINRRNPQNERYHITFVNGTDVQWLRGSMLQLHSHQGMHRFYSALFEQEGDKEEYYLFLVASVEVVLVHGVYRELVQGVRLISSEELVLSYNPIMYNLA